MNSLHNCLTQNGATRRKVCADIWSYNAANQSEMFLNIVNVLHTYMYANWVHEINESVEVPSARQ